MREYGAEGRLTPRGEQTQPLKDKYLFTLPSRLQTLSHDRMRPAESTGTYLITCARLLGKQIKNNNQREHRLKDRHTT